MRRGTMLLAAALLVSACGKGEAVRADVVTTDTGQVRGEQRDGHMVFQGMPYAAKPERWQPRLEPRRGAGSGTH